MHLWHMMQRGMAAETAQAAASQQQDTGAAHVHAADRHTAAEACVLAGQVGLRSHACAEQIVWYVLLVCTGKPDACCTSTRVAAFYIRSHQVHVAAFCTQTATDA